MKPVNRFLLMFVEKPLKNAGIPVINDYVAVACSGELETELTEPQQDFDSGVSPFLKNCTLTPKLNSTNKDIRILTRVEDVNYTNDYNVEVKGLNHAHGLISIKSEYVQVVEPFLVPHHIYSKKYFDDLNFNPQYHSECLRVSDWPNAQDFIASFPVHEFSTLIMTESDFEKWCTLTGKSITEDITEEITKEPENEDIVQHTLYSDVKISKSSRKVDAYGNGVFDKCSTHCESFAKSARACSLCNLKADMECINNIAIAPSSFITNFDEFLSGSKPVFANYSIATMQRLVIQGFKLTLWSSETTAHIESVKEYMKNKGINFSISKSDIPSELYSGTAPRKIIARHYIEGSNILPVDWLDILNRLSRATFTQRIKNRIFVPKS